MPERTSEDDDRRRSPRFSCAGHAKISCLPSDGIFLPGQIRDLSLGGCCIDTTLPIDHGVRTEMVVRVNAASFRAVGEVRAIRAGSGACVEFVHLSAGGKDILADLVRELARLQAIIKKLRSDRREMDEESFRRHMENGKLQAAILSGRFRLVGTNLGVELSGESSGPDQAASEGKNLIGEAQPLVIPVDLFG
jgi:hypothetical protein